MARFVLFRLGRAFLTVAVVLVLTFVGSRISGDPIAALYKDGLPPEQEEALRAYLGLDRPLPVQFAIYVTDLARGDFGRSFVESRSVPTMYWERLPNTVMLGTLAFVVSTVMGILSGVLAAWRRGSWLGRAAMGLAFVGYAMPSFVVAVLLILLFSFTLGWLPSVGNATLWHFVMPVAVLSLGMAASLARFTRGAMLDCLNENYIRTARAKGAGERRTVFGHALPNALIPTITITGLHLVGLVNGSIVVESVFAMPGVGELLIGAVKDKDYPVLQFGVIVYAALVSLINLGVDIAYGFADPRIRAEA